MSLNGTNRQTVNNNTNNSNQLFQVRLPPTASSISSTNNNMNKINDSQLNSTTTSFTNNNHINNNNHQIQLNNNNKLSTNQDHLQSKLFDNGFDVKEEEVTTTITATATTIATSTTDWLQTDIKPNNDFVSYLFHFLELFFRAELKF
jgi:hypothetical protein